MTPSVTIHSAVVGLLVVSGAVADVTRPNNVHADGESARSDPSGVAFSAIGRSVVDTSPRVESSAPERYYGSHDSAAPAQLITNRPPPYGYAAAGESAPGGEVTVREEVPVPYYVQVEKRIPYPVLVRVPHPYPVTVDRHVPYAVRVNVDRPVHVPQPYPVEVEKRVPYPVEKPVPYEVRVPVDRPYPVHVPYEKPVPYAVEKPVPYPVRYEVPVDVPVPVEVRVPVTVDRPVPYPVEKNVPYPVRVPYEVKVPVPVQGPAQRFATVHYYQQSPAVLSARGPYQNGVSGPAVRNDGASGRQQTVFESSKSAPSAGHYPAGLAADDASASYGSQDFEAAAREELSAGGSRDGNYGNGK